jgi:hypothetical protein
MKVLSTSSSAIITNAMKAIVLLVVVVSMAWKVRRGGYI